MRPRLIWLPIILLLATLYALSFPTTQRLLRTVLGDGREFVERQGVQYVDISPRVVDSILAPDSKILYIGNSHTFVNQVPRLVASIANCFGKSFWYETALVPGRTLSQHSEDTYTLDLLRRKKWNFVIIQPSSTEPIADPLKFQRGLRALEDEAFNVGAESILYCTWGRDAVTDVDHLYQNFSWAGKSFFDMTERLDKSCRKAQTKSILAPVGMAWSVVLKANPELKLHSADGNHAEIPGSFLAALMLYHKLDPAADLTQCSYAPEGVSAEIAKMLREEAARL